MVAMGVVVLLVLSMSFVAWRILMCSLRIMGDDFLAALDERQL